MNMVEEIIRLIGGSYSSVDDGVVIELYGRTDDGNSITLLYDGFDPYFYLVDTPEDIISELETDDEIKRLEDEELWVDGSYKRCKRVVLTYPWKVPGYRKKYRDRCKILAADIPFIQRFIYDLDLGSTVSAEGTRREMDGYTTDIVMDVDKFRETETIKPDLSILSFDIENSIDRERIYTIGCVFDDNEGREKVCFYGDEDDIIRSFRDYVKEKDPDVITGYNINGYDLPLLDKRLDEVELGDLDIGRDGGNLKNVSNRNWKVNGRIIADAWWTVRTEMNLKRETLNHVSKEVLGEEKQDVDPKEIDEEWRKNPEKVMDYCKKDAELALDILLELGSLDKAMDMGTVSRLPIDEGLNGRTSTLVDSILIREADRNDIGVPLTSHGGKGGKIKGGYVHSVEPGLYHWVSVLDFKSMYPSIIMENNICFTTISEDGEIESPTGTKFLKPEEEEGILPKILKDLMDERDSVKKKVQEADSKKKREYFDGLQAAIKILMNSFYGVFASSFYRFTDKRIGESITALARKNIKNLIDELEEEGLKVIYSDTDSVFFQSPKEDLEDTIQVSEDIAEEFSKGAIILEFEKVLNPFFTHGMKKRYVGKVIWPEEDMLVRGYELRRSDSFEAQDRALQHIFDLILDDDIEGAVERAKEWIRRAYDGDIEPKNLVISRTCKKYSYYKNPESMPNVQAAKKMEEEGYEFTPGMKVSWVVTDGEITPQEVEPWLPDTDLKKEPDWDYYAKRIAKTLARVTEVFNWDEQSLLAGNKQADLFSGDFDDKSGVDEDEDRSKDKDEGGQESNEKDRDRQNRSLEDFM